MNKIFGTNRERVKTPSKNNQKMELRFFAIVIFLSVFIFSTVFAATNAWDFSTSSDYTFDNTKIEFSSGQVQLKATSTPVAWYDPTWGRRKAISIDNTGNSDTLTNYQVQVSVTYDSDMQADFDDIRFTNSDGTTLLDYWLEEKTDSTSATFWVETPDIAGSSEETVYMYYGNSGASSASSGSDTFSFFDDFINTKTHLFPYGSDSGWMSGFDPVSRKFYFFGSSADNLADYDVTPWVNVDTWEVGFVYPSLTFSGAGVIYSPDKQKFYIYGGTDGGTPVNKIYSFDPATETFTLLSETLPDSVFNPQPVLDPTTGKVYIFGGRSSFSGSSQFVNRIAVHNLDLETPTVTDTTAVLPTASDGMEPVYSTSDGKIYLFGGAYNNGANVNSLDSILSYDPTTPSVDPIDTGVDMASALDTMSTAYYNGNIYLFGGYNFTTTTYYSTIQKFNVTNQTIETLPTSMYKADDDAKAFYDSVTGKIYVGPTLHSTGSTNEDERKVVILEFDPGTETLSAEPALGTTPSGWTSIGNAPVEIPRGVGGSYMTLADQYTNSYVGAKISFSQLSGVNMLEFKTSIPNATGNNQFYLGPTAINFLVNSAVVLRNRNSTNWEIGTGASTGQTITSITNGYHILGALVDVPNQKQYGLVDRANKTSALNWLNADQTLTTVVINTSTAGTLATLVDWVLIRKSTTGTEPSTNLGSETSIYDSNNPTVQPITATTFTSLSGFAETSTLGGGTIKYQVSNDGGTTWYWYNSGWTTTSAGYSESNTASDINTNISTLPVGSGSFLWRAYLHSDGTQLVQLDNIDLTYTNDTTAPTVTDNGSSSGILSAGTTSGTLAVSTTENAQCKYDTTANTAFGSMANTFSTTGTTTSTTNHSTTVSGLSNGNSYTYYIRCQDAVGNATTTDLAISFSVASPSSGGGGGWTAPPPTAPAGGFTATASASTSADKQILTFNFGSDVTRIVIADNTAFAPASYVNATSTLEWSISQTGTWYVKFCNTYSKCSSPIEVSTPVAATTQAQRALQQHQHTRIPAI